MANRNPLERIFKQAVGRQPGRKGGLWGMILFALIALIGFFNPELRDKILGVVKIGSIPNPIEDNRPLDSKSTTPLEEGIWPVVHIVDGDTLDVQDDKGTKYRIRLIGANTPETVKPNHPVEPFGPEASAFTKQVVSLTGNRVRIAFDGDRVDRYGRTLAMVYLQTEQGEVWLNELLVRQGLAVATLQYRFSKGAKDRLAAAEAAAKAERKNIWSQNQ